MKIRTAALVALLAVFVLSACSASTPAASTAVSTRTPTSSSIPTRTFTPRPTITRAATLTPTVTKELLELEILDSDVSEDRFGNTRVTVTIRNPYDFAVETQFRPRATLYDANGDVLRSQELLEEGVYGPMLFQPGSTHTLYGCYDPCDGGVSVGEWVTYAFIFILQRVE
jgi:hypothetical protein